MPSRHDDQRWSRWSPTMTFRKTLAALLRSAAAAIEPPAPTLQVMLEEVATPPADAGSGVAAGVGPETLRAQQMLAQMTLVRALNPNWRVGSA